MVPAPACATSPETSTREITGAGAIFSQSSDSLLSGHFRRDPSNMHSRNFIPIPRACIRSTARVPPSGKRKPRLMTRLGFLLPLHDLQKRTTRTTDETSTPLFRLPTTDLQKRTTDETPQPPSSDSPCYRPSKENYK
jgi:hypothetical protein